VYTAICVQYRVGLGAAAAQAAASDKEQNTKIELELLDPEENIWNLALL
jgi:hypothetical protein